MRDAGQRTSPARRPRAAPPCTPPLPNGARRGPAAGPTVSSPAANRRQQGSSPGPGSRPPSAPQPPAVPRRPHPSAQRSRPNPAPHNPARRTKPRHPPPPTAFPSPTPAPRRPKGRPARGSPARWIPGPLRGARGAGERSPQTQTLLLSGRRSRHFLAEPAARPGRVTQQLARWRAGPCSRPPPALRARVPRRRRLPGSAGPRLRGAAGGRPPRLQPSGSLTRGRNATEPVSQTWVWKVVLEFRDPGELGVPGETHPTPQTKGWGRRKRKFFSFALRLEGQVRKRSALCFAKECLSWALKPGFPLPRSLQRSARLSFVISTGSKRAGRLPFITLQGGCSSVQVGAAKWFLFSSSPATSTSSFTLNSQKISLGPDAFRVSSPAKSALEGWGGALRRGASGSSSLDIYSGPK